MSVNDKDQGASIARGSPLARVLDDYAVPGLSAGFADRVLAAAEARPAPLPGLRRARRGWRLGRGIAIGVVSFGALATAAAATGLLQQFDLPVPSAETVWASITGTPSASAAAPAPPVKAAPPAASEPATLARVDIVGAIDTPEELGEVFRRIEEVREGRFAARRERIDQRIASAIEQRRAAGLPLPTPEEEARFRERVDTAETRRQAVAEERLAARREEMQRKIDNGEALTREDIAQGLRDDAEALRRLERLRQLRRLSPEARREALRQMPPEERRALIEDYRARRSGVAAAGLEPAPAPAPPPAPATPPASALEPAPAE